MNRNLHNNPFDEGTLAKLDLFETYTKEWLPVFIMKGSRIFIFDYFAGTGYSITNQPGSPIRILTQVANQTGYIFQKQSKITLVFNEYDKSKYDKLMTSCNQFVSENNDLSRMKEAGLLKIEYRNMDFDELFPKTISTFNNGPSLLFLDQNGIKFLSDKYFDKLKEVHCVDFLYFVSSSYINRFCDTPQFKSCISIDKEKIKREGVRYVHQIVLEEMRKKIPPTSNLRLYPFSIKKGANIYGIIFGSAHPKGVDKFLGTAWKMNSINGCANFDIDCDQEKRQLDIFENKLTKIQKFKNDLQERILSGVIHNNQQAYDYTLDNGHIAQHAKEAINELKTQKKIQYDSTSPLCNYEHVYGPKSRIIEYVKL